MVHVQTVLAFQEDAQQSMGVCLGGFQLHGIFFPVLARNLQSLLGNYFVMRTYQFHADLCITV